MADKAYQKFYINSEKKPFWTGKEEVQVCKVPYYSSDSCKKLSVELLDNDRARIYYTVTVSKKEETKGVPTEQEFKQAYLNAVMAGDTKAADTIKEASEFLHPETTTTEQRSMDVGDLECWFTSNYQYEKEMQYVFCRSWDKDGQQYDLHPTWVSIN